MHTKEQGAGILKSAAVSKRKLTIAFQATYGVVVPIRIMAKTQCPPKLLIGTLGKVCPTGTTQVD